MTESRRRFLAHSATAGAGLWAAQSAPTDRIGIGVIGCNGMGSVVASGGKCAYPDDAEETPDTLQAIYEFDDFSMIWEHAVGIGLGHTANFIECMQTRAQPRCHAATGSLVAVNAHLGNVSFRTNRKVHWDASAHRFRDNAEANRMLTPRYRGPWQLERVTSAGVSRPW